MSSTIQKEPQQPVDAALQFLASLFNLLTVIFHVIRKALGIRIAQDDIDDFMNKPNPNFASAAPQDPNYQTLASLDNAVFNVKPKQPPPPAVRRK
uniref:MscL family protein n=1 Tax=Panagrellus redivivus TaxID=6233 RepID=A0A7E4VJQ6_PANRE